MPRLARLLPPLVAAVCLAAVTSCSKDPPGPTPVPPTLIPAPQGLARPSPTAAPPLGEADMVVPAWREVTEAELPEAPYQSVLLDIASGRFYRAGATPANENRDGGVSIVGWLPNGDAVIESRVSVSEGPFQTVGALYVAEPLGAFRRLTPLYQIDSGRAQFGVSSGGLIAWQAGDENLLIDPQSGQTLARLPAPPHEIVAWSTDGNLLAMQGDEHDVDDFVLVWDRRSGNTQRIEEAQPAAWSNSGHKLAYLKLAGDRNHPIRVHDFDSGADMPVGLGAGAITWSANDRYLAFNALNFYETTIFDTQTGRSVIITASTSGGWVDGDTFFFLGETCEEETLYTIEADGSGLRAVAPLDWVFAEPHLGPDGDTVAFNGLPRDSRWIVKLASLSRGRVIAEFGSGEASSRVSGRRTAASWCWSRRSGGMPAWDHRHG